MVNVYKNTGENGFIHGNIGKIPINKISYEINNKLVVLRTEEFYDFNYLHALDIIKDEFDITVSYNHLYNLWMSKIDPSKEAHKSTKKYIRKQLKLLLKEEPNIDSTKIQ